MPPAPKNPPLYHQGPGFLITSAAHNENISRQLKFDFESNETDDDKIPREARNDASSGSAQAQTVVKDQILRSAQNDPSASSGQALTKYALGIHIQPDTHSYQFSLSAGTAEKKDAQLHIYYTTDYLQRPAIVYPFLNNHPETKIRLCNPAMAGVIINILHCDLSPAAGALYSEAKVLKLLVLVGECLAAAQPSASLLKLTSDDIAMLEKERDILVSDFENIPTIKQLARKVGTNDLN